MQRKQGKSTGRKRADRTRSGKEGAHRAEGESGDSTSIAREEGSRSPAVGQRSLAAEPQLPSVYVTTATNYPLIYRKRIERADAKARPGDLAAVYSAADDSLLGYGLYNPRSEIVLRMLQYGSSPPDADFWRKRLAEATALRREKLGLDAQTSAYRVVHAEGDGLSGLVVDRLGEVLSCECYSLGMYQRAEAILADLAPRCGTSQYLIQTSPQFLSQEGYAPPLLASPGLPERVTIAEYGTKFVVQFSGGHKTGFFCDQRENRLKLAEFCAGKSVLDLCCYTGGFTVQALARGKAASAIGVDLDEEPLAIARENARLNRVAGQFVQADAFAYMRDMIRNGRQFDVVVLDPPKLIRSRNEIEEGTKKHYDLNRLAVQLVRPGGLLLSCCCAGLLGGDEFMRLVFSAAKHAHPPDAKPATGMAGRSVQLIARTGAAADHPVAGNYWESEYLKAAWLIVQ